MGLVDVLIGRDGKVVTGLIPVNGCCKTGCGGKPVGTISEQLMGGRVGW